jgi:adenine C2-methylase RlmN of 23S rRNA A2503 and tRNA A37
MNTKEELTEMIKEVEEILDIITKNSDPGDVYKDSHWNTMLKYNRKLDNFKQRLSILIKDNLEYN